MSRLSDIIATDLPGFMADFGDPATYIPKKDGVARSLYVMTEYAREEDITIDNVLATENEHLWGTLQSDQDDAVYGGVTNPVIGDLLQLAADSPDSRWAFAGQVEEIPGGWRMAFFRRRVTRYGPTR